jgi:hypothetical protein
VREQRKDGKPVIRFVPSKVTVTSLGRELAGSLAELRDPSPDRYRRMNGKVATERHGPWLEQQRLPAG